MNFAGSHEVEWRGGPGAVVGGGDAVEAAAAAGAAAVAALGVPGGLGRRAGRQLPGHALAAAER